MVRGRWMDGRTEKVTHRSGCPPKKRTNKIFPCLDPQEDQKKDELVLINYDTGLPFLIAERNAGNRDGGGLLEEQGVNWAEHLGQVCHKLKVFYKVCDSSSGS